MLHRHQWKQCVVTYAAPSTLDAQARKYLLLNDVAELHRRTAGITSVLYVCNGCKKLKLVEMLGKPVSS